MATYRSDRHLPAEELTPSLRERAENPAATGFVVIDRDGSAVACSLSMNNLFGTGRIAPGTGIFLAMPPGLRGGGPISLGPMVVVNDFVNAFYFAAVASGGAAAPTALTQVALATLVGGKPLEEAMNAKRLHHGGLPDLVYYEQGFDVAGLRALTERNHHIAATSVLGRVNAGYCPKGLPPNARTCAIRTDPRGFGLATSAEQ